jgi:hypothetical protein
MLFGDTITFAPNIKNWWQAISLGGANYIGGIMEGMLAGAAVGMGGAMITGARTAFLTGGTRAVGQASLNVLKSIPANVLQNIGATFGYAGGFSVTSVSVAVGLRGLTAAQAGLDHYGKTGESGWSEAGKGVFGMEEGMAHSVNNIATGNATWQDIAGVAVLGSPAHKTVKEEPKAKGEEAPKIEEPIKNTTLAEPEPIKKKADGEAFEASPKPKNSPDVAKWEAKGGKVEVNGDTWKYTDWEGNVVEYKNGYPDFEPYSRQSVDIGKQEGNHTTDYTNAKNNSKKIPPKEDNTTWHHHEDGKTMQEVDKKIHERFTHNGGVSNAKKVKLGIKK